MAYINTFNRAVDKELEIVASTAFTATTTSTPVEIVSVGSGDYDLGVMINVASLAGTHDGSNNFTVEVKAGETSGGSFFTFKSTDTTELSVGVNLIGLNTREIMDAVGSSDSAFYEVTVTKVGTTATGATLSAHFVKGV